MDKLEQKQIEVDKNLDDLSFYLDGLFKVPGIGWGLHFLDTVFVRD